MTRLGDALRRIHPTRESALRALGLDASVLDDQPITQTKRGTTMAKSLVRFQDSKTRRQMARDAEPGMTITPERIEQIMELLGDDDTAKKIRYLLDGGMSCDDADPLDKLRKFLKRNGTL